MHESLLVKSEVTVDVIVVDCEDVIELLSDVVAVLESVVVAERDSVLMSVEVAVEVLVVDADLLSDVVAVEE